MQIQHASAEFVLNENHPLAARHARGVVIRCMAGRVWITLTGHADDVFLAAGESWICVGDGLLLIDALNRAQVLIEAPASRLDLLPALRRQAARLLQFCQTRWHGAIGRLSHPA